MATRVIREPSETEVVHEHVSDGNNGSGAGVVIGAIVLLVIVILFLFYGLPLIRNVSSPQVNVPGQVDVNVHSSK